VRLSGESIRKTKADLTKSPKPAKQRPPSVITLRGDRLQAERVIGIRRNIERFNRTVAEGFEPEARAARIEDLERLNLLFEAWLEQRYHLVPHGSIGERPLDRFAQPGFTPRYPDPVLLQGVFRVRVKRRVHPKTATVEVEGFAFQCERFRAAAGCASSTTPSGSTTSSSSSARGACSAPFHSR
jgi:hypothetical protein